MRKWKKEEKERDRGREGETSYMGVLIGEEERRDEQLVEEIFKRLLNVSDDREGEINSLGFVRVRNK